MYNRRNFLMGSFFMRAAEMVSGLWYNGISVGVTEMVGSGLGLERVLYARVLQQFFLRV